jgi:hypothetical protein
MWKLCAYVSKLLSCECVKSHFAYGYRILRVEINLVRVHLCVFDLHSCLSKSDCVFRNYSERVGITLERVESTLVRVEITLFVYKIHSACINYTLRV